MPDPSLSSSPFGSRFAVGALVGAGRNSEVYQAYDRIQCRGVALKILKSTEPAAIVRLRQEFVRLSKLRTLFHASPHLVGYYRLLVPPVVHVRGGVRPGERALLSMEFVDGGVPLHRWLRGATPTERSERLEPMLLQILRGLSTLHAAGLVHRDVSPGNVLVVDSAAAPRGVLVDYGLSLRGIEPSLEGAGRGAYVAPEERGRPATGRACSATDIWALGMTLCDLVLGRPPVPGMPGRPRVARAELSKRWTQLLGWMLEEQPGRRPSPMALIRWLEQSESSMMLASVGPTDQASASSDDERTEHHQRLVRALLGTSIETSVVLLTGRPASRVSALVESALETCIATLTERGQPPLVLRVECEQGLFQSHGAVRALGDALMGHLRGELRHEMLPLRGARALSRIIEGLSLVDGLFAVDDDDDEVTERLAAEALRALFDRLQQGRRILVVIDGAHRGDPDSARLLAELLDPPLPGLVIVLVGPSAGPLHSFGELVVHPCHITLESGSGAEAEGPPSTSAPLEQIEAMLLRGLAMAQLPLKAEAVVTLASQSEATDPLVRTLFKLEDRGVLDTTGDERLVLPPGELRETIMSAMSDEQRGRWHDRIADLLLRSPVTDPTPLFHHLVGAGRYEEARAYGERAAQYAAERLAHRAEVEIHEALARLPGAEGDWRRLATLGMALIRAGETRKSGAVLERAATTLRQLGGAVDDSERLLRIAGRQMMFAGDFDRGKALFLRAALELGIRPPRSAGQALVEALLRRLWLVLTEGLCGRVRVGARPDPDPRRAQALWDASMATAMVDFPTSDALAMRHMGTVRGTGLRSAWLRALSREAASCANLGGRWLHRRAQRVEAACAWLGADSEDPLDTAWVRFAKRSTAWFRADWPVAAQAARDAERILRLECHGVAWDLAVNTVFLTSALAMMGEVDELRDRVEIALRGARSRADRYTATSLRLGEPVLGFAQGSCAPLLARAEEELRSWPFHEIPGLLFPWIQTLVGCALYEGRAREAREAFDRAWASVTRTGLVRLECVGIILRHARGRLLLATGRAREAQRISARLRRSSLGMGRAMSLALGAGVAAADRPDVAYAQLGDAADAFERSAMGMYAAACRHRQIVLGGGRDPRSTLLGLPHADRIIDALVPVGPPES